MHYATLQIMHYANWHYNAILKMHFASAIENAFPSSRNAFYKNGSVGTVRVDTEGRDDVCEDGRLVQGHC